MKRFLNTDASLLVLLIAVFALLFVLYPVFEPHSISRQIIDLLTLVVLVSGAYTVSDRRGLMPLCAALAVSTFALKLVLYAKPEQSILMVRLASMMLFLGVVTGAVLYKVLRKGRVTAHRVAGAVAVYLMLGMLWALAYSLLFMHDPGSFDLGQALPMTGDPVEIQTEATSRLIYFSFVTMTTLGYGDVTPTSAAAGNLAILQALTGQLYLAVILARIVALVVARPEEE